MGNQMENLVEALEKFFPNFTTMIEPVKGAHWTFSGEGVRWEVDGTAYSAESRGGADSDKGIFYCNADNSCGETLTYVFEKRLMLTEEEFEENYG